MNSRFGLWVAVFGTFGGAAAILFLGAEQIFSLREALLLFVALTVLGGCYLFERTDRLERKVDALSDKLDRATVLIDGLLSRGR